MTSLRSRFTIERLRTLLLIGGGLLVVSIVAFLVAGQWKRRFNWKDVPGRLGVNIEQHADSVIYTQTRKGKTIFRLQASKADTLREGGSTLLHNVKIDLYGDDGNRTDTISGSEFQYDPKAGIAKASGEVEITMVRPGVKPAISELKPGELKAKDTKNQVKDGSTTSPFSPVSTGITDSEIHVKTSGLVFNQKTGVATTSERVNFALRQGYGNSLGATYDSQNGELVLDHAVELHAERGTAQGGGPITIHAGHAEFEHDAMACTLIQASADYTGGTAQIAHALIHFRDDGSVMRLDGSGGVDLQTKAGGHVTAPVGALDFDENSHPSHGLLQGGAKLDMNQPNRQVQGSSPTARLTFDGAGQLSQAHMEQGVVFNSQQQGTNAKGVALQLHRTWKSQSADVVFSPAPSTMPKNGLKSQVGRPVQEGTGSLSPARVEPRTIRGYGGVVVTSESTSGGVTTPSRLAADTVVVELAPGGSITSLVGNGRAIFEDQTAAGVHQASSADQLEISFLPAITKQGGREIKPTADKSRDPGAGAEIASVVEIGHVVLLQEPPSGHSASNRDKAGVRATSSRADYDGPSQILHLTGTPRVQDGALDLTANRIDLARATGDAFAHGDVRASWVGSGTGTVAGTSLLAGTGSGGNGRVHAIAEEAELRQSTQEVIFRMGGNAQSGEPRMWQSVNSVTAPVITLNRQKQTLTAEANGVANPVKTVLVSNASVTGSGSSKGTKPEAGGPSVIRVRSGELHYSEGERLALFHSGSLGSVTAETTGANGESTIVSREAEVKLASAGTHFASVSSGAVSDMVKSPGASNASVDRLTASGHVVVDWPNHRGTGERLVYLSDDGNFTLTGTSTVPPRITDQAQSSVTGSALIYHSRDGSVTVEGDGGRTQTETRSKK